MRKCQACYETANFNDPKIRYRGILKKKQESAEGIVPGSLTRAIYISREAAVIDQRKLLSDF